eukprot:2050848-Amphidinium_carterae.1
MGDFRGAYLYIKIEKETEIKQTTKPEAGGLQCGRLDTQREMHTKFKKETKISITLRTCSRPAPPL